MSKPLTLSDRAFPAPFQMVTVPGKLAGSAEVRPVVHEAGGISALVYLAAHCPRIESWPLVAGRSDRARVEELAQHAGEFAIRWARVVLELAAQIEADQAAVHRRLHAERGAS